MKELLTRFETKAPEIVFEWHDAETPAKGWVVINSLRGGAAGGGTRMRRGLDRREVESLAKTMEVKFSVSGPAIGGAKSGIDFDPADPRKDGVLRRWYKAVTPLLKTYYGTGGDLNVDEVHEVIPITESYGLWHPQEGVVNGHFQPSESQRIQKVGQLRLGVAKVVEDPRYTPDMARKYLVADLITGWGVAESVLHYYGIYGGAGRRASGSIVQGWGNVGSAAAWYLAQAGATDRRHRRPGNGGLLSATRASRFDAGARAVPRTSRAMQLERRRGILSFEEVNAQGLERWARRCSCPAPRRGSSRRAQVDADGRGRPGGGLQRRQRAVRRRARSSTARPTNDADGQVAVIPDFIANCGMARAFAFLMGQRASRCQRCGDLRRRVADDRRPRCSPLPQPAPASHQQIASTAFEIALAQLV